MSDVNKELTQAQNRLAKAIQNGDDDWTIQRLQEEVTKLARRVNKNNKKQSRKGWERE